MPSRDGLPRSSALRFCDWRDRTQLDEVLEVRLPGVGLLVRGQRRAGLVLPSEVHLGLVVADLHPSFGAEDVDALRLGRAAEPVAYFAVKLCAIRILKRRLLRIRRHLIGRRAFLVQTADRVCRAGMLLFAEQPAHRVQRMHAGVAQIAGAVFPEPVPVVMEMVLVERTRRRGSQPQVVMHARRHRAVRRNTDRIPEAIDDRLPS